MVRPAEVDLTLRWIEDRLAFFDPLPQGKLDYAKLKAFGELSLVCLYLAEWQGRLPAEIAASIERFLQRCTPFLQQQCERPIYLEAARKDPLQGYAYLLPYLCLRRFGFRSAPLEQLIRWLRQFDLPLSVEAIPYRQWDRLLALWKGGLLRQVPACSTRYRDTALALRHSTIYVDMEDAYAFTHTVFYMTDFGLQAPAISPAETQRTGIVLQGLLVHYLRRQNWDLACELLMCLHQLRLPEDLLMQEASVAFSRIRRADGSMPAHGPRFHSGTRRRPRSFRQRSAADQYTLGCYHPTFVWLLYASCRPYPDLHGD